MDHTKGLLVEQDLGKELQDIMSDMECPKDFICYRSEFETVCKARDIDLYTYVECLEVRFKECPFSFSLSSRRVYCKCPLRVHICKELGK